MLYHFSPVSYKIKDDPPKKKTNLFPFPTLQRRKKVIASLFNSFSGNNITSANCGDLAEYSKSNAVFQRTINIAGP